MQIEKPALALYQNIHPFEIIIQDVQLMVSKAISHVTRIKDSFVTKAINKRIKVSL